jgi:hypothetical protein
MREVNAFMFIPAWILIALLAIVVLALLCFGLLVWYAHANDPSR